MNSQGDTFFRANTLKLVQPKVHTWIGDVTAQVQTIVDDLISKDGDNNQLVDVSLLIRFLRTTDPKAANSETTIGGGRCPFPVAQASACGPEPLFPFQSPSVSYANQQSCALQDTQDVAPGPCFASARASLTINIPLLGPVPLQDGQVIGTWQDGGIVNGRVRGFLPQTVAAATKLPTSVPLEFLAVVTPGGPLTDHLSTAELGKNARGEDGWWFVLTFTATPATFNPALTPQQ